MLGETLVEVLGGLVAEQEAAGVAEGPLGRAVETCPILDQEALDGLGMVLGVEPGTVQVLSAQITTPSASPGVTCALRVSDASAGAVVVGAVPTDQSLEEVVAELEAADFNLAGEGGADGLPDSEVVLLDSTRFDASRAVWSRPGLAVSVTGNTDVVADGQLLTLLASAVEEVQRILR
ncbi:hypothetical protein [Euzebya tangerina]|uniref:hypothetical protein n=1 Tax=Euzebya tangerina TaxID=591198 RepID=UPI000E3100A7|nr:hypothetical protein [Euzebya tangerina]